jgi:hypothetical protein
VVCVCLAYGCSSGDEFESAGDAGSGKGAGPSGGSSSGGGGGSSGTIGAAGAPGGRDGGAGATGGTGGSGGGAAASGGTQGAGATGGSAGSRGGAAGAGGASGGAAGAGGAGGQPCTWGMPNNCPAGSFCNALGCAAGSCMAVPNEGPMRSPVCGCDGLNYWNASVAAHRGMSVKSVGECSQGFTCGGIASIDCPGIASCNYRIQEALECSSSDLGGSCWVLPATCPPPGIGFGPRTRACGAPVCADECPLIKAEQPFYVDSSCPQ